MISWAGTQYCSFEAKPSESPKYSSLLSHQQELMIALTMKADRPSIFRGLGDMAGVLMRQGDLR